MPTTMHQVFISLQYDMQWCSHDFEVGGTK